MEVNILNKTLSIIYADTYDDSWGSTIEELYTNFKIFVDGFCNQDIDMDEEISE